MSDINHSSRAHALLSASGASRWINCTPSARLEEKFETSTSSSYAQEGELAHELGELMLMKALGKISEKVFNREFKKIEKHKLYADDMLPNVEVYVNYCMDQYTTYLKDEKYCEPRIEERLDFSHIVPMGFGTGDFGLVAKKTLEIIDLKYGKGIRVDATDNSQLRLYALGALQEAELISPIHTIKMTIVQPRLDHISSEEILINDLKAWGESIKPIARRAHKGEGEKVAGSWCKFCKIKPTCKALMDKSLDIARADFEDPHMVPLEKLIGLRSQFPMISDWINSVEKYLLKKALDGEKLPGLKLVSGRANRKWVNENDVIDKLKEMRIRKKDYIQEKLIGIPAMEKLLKDDQLEKISSNILKPEGSPTLVDESDPRPARGLAQAQADFSEDT